MSRPAADGVPAPFEEPDPPMVVLFVHHVRMPVGEHLPADVVLCPRTNRGSGSLILPVGPAEAEALLSVQRGADPAGRKRMWMDLYFRALTRAAALYGRRLLLRLVPGPADIPVMRLEATNEFSTIETPIPVSDGLLASLQWGIPLLADARLLRFAKAESGTLTWPAKALLADQPTSEPDASSLYAEDTAVVPRAAGRRRVGRRSGTAVWRSAMPGSARA